MPPRARLEAAARIGLVVVGLSPFLVPFARQVLSSESGARLDAIFKIVCHRNPARTLALAGVLMPICSRCAGIFAGFVTGGLVPRPAWSVRACLLWGFVASVIMVADVLTQDAGLHPVLHPVRLLTGVLWGHVAALGVLAIVREHLAPRPVPPRRAIS